MILWLALACVAPEPPLEETGEVVVDSGSDDSAGGDSASDDSGGADDSAPDDSGGADDSGASPYLGQVVDPPLPPPAFAVVNSEHQARTPEWLAGAPTVVWFFRDASSST